MNAIVYTSETGHTEEYAKLLGMATGQPVYSMEEAEKRLPKGSSVIYMGWLMAGTIKGYRKASKRYDILAVCGVGMADGDEQYGTMRKANGLGDNLPLFYLQGGFEMEKLSGVYKLMMQAMKKTVGKKLSEQKERTVQEEEMLELLMNGGSKVSGEKLKDILEWYEENEK